MSLQAIFESVETDISEALKSPNVIETLHNRFNLASNEDCLTKRRKTVNHLVEIISEIQRISQIKSNSSDDSLKDVISISLHDMKTLNSMVNIIVVEGIYPCLSVGNGIPLHLRGSKLSPPDKSPQVLRPLLEESMTKIISILEIKGDVRDLLLLGPFCTDFISAAIELDHGTKGTSWLQRIELQMETYSLLSYYTSLVRPEAPSWVKVVVTNRLARIPLDRAKDGVKSMIEFVSGLRDKEEISQADLERTVKILRSVPKSTTSEVYFRAVGKQLYQILSRYTMPSPVASQQVQDVIASTIYITEKLAVRSPLILEEFITVFNPVDNVTSEKSLESGARVLFTISQENVSLLSSIASPVAKPLWILYVYLVASKRPSDRIKAVLQKIIPTSLNSMIESFLDDGSDTWVYGAGSEGGVEIRQREATLDTRDLLSELELRIGMILPLLKDLDDNQISGIFIMIINKWLVKAPETKLGGDDPFLGLVQLKLLEGIIENYRDKLLKSSKDIFMVITSVITDQVTTLLDSKSEKSLLNMMAEPQVELDLDNEVDSDDEGDSDDEDDDTISSQTILDICLTLLANLTTNDPDIIGIVAKIRPKIEYIRDHVPSLHQKACIALMAIDSPQGEEDENLTDSKSVLDRAIASLDDLEVPNRAYGLHLIQKLVQRKDPIVTSKQALDLFLAQLKDEDSYVYLNALSGIDSVSESYGYQSVLPSLIMRYTHQGNLDEKLRIGEALVKIIERHGATMPMGVYKDIVNQLVGIVSKRNNKAIDDRLRMSAMSIISVACELSPMAFLDHMSDIADLVIGILTFETSEDQAIMRRTALYVIGSLMKAIPLKQLDLSQSQIDTIIARTQSCHHDNDSLVKLQASTVLAELS